MHNLHTEDNHVQHRNMNEKYVSRNNPRKTRFFSSATKVKPCQAGLGTGWVTHCEYRREGPYFVLSFLLPLFSVLCSVIFKSVLKSIISIISATWFRKNRKHKHGSTVRLKIIILRAIVQNFDLSAGNLNGKLINLGFPGCETKFQARFQGKRQGFDGKKPYWNALWRNISRDILNSLNRT